MKKFSINIAIIFATLIILFTTSMLLETVFIKALIVRQIIIYLVMIVQVFIAYRAIIIINSEENV